jgi:fructose-bisphosphate aldolase, class I
MTTELEKIAKTIMSPGKGILAADESTSTIEKRFKSIDVASTEENRRAYRDMLFTTPEIANYISGVILYDETIKQKAADGTAFPQLLAKLGVVPGIKVDTGAKPLPFSPNEQITEGLDGLRERLKEYFKLGARFAKWRAVITIGDGIPSAYCLRANAEALARYSALCQEQGIVPIVEPEVLMDGAHTIERCDEVTTETLRVTFETLIAHRVSLEGMLLKPNMVIHGKGASKKAAPDEVARRTIQCFKRTVPAAVPGIVFLSGGQSETEATLHLDLMNKMGPLPWPLSFSYGRALQDSALKAWKGQKANIAAGQRAYSHRAKCNSLAQKGKYDPKMESEMAKA